MIDVTIVREEWLRGTDDGMLLDTGGKKCCLGFACGALGLPDSELLAIGRPVEVYRTDGPDLMGLVNDIGGDSDFTDNAIEINDADDTSDAEKEALLIPLAKEAGFNFIFV